MRVLPLLKDEHREARLAYAKSTWMMTGTPLLILTRNGCTGYGVHTHALLKLPPGEPVPIQPVQSKRHLPKVMVLTALARPRFNEDGTCVFDGKICCERVAEPTGPRAKREWKDVPMNAAKYEKLVTTVVFPAIVKAFKNTGVREVTLQQDGARCHTQKKKDGTEAMTKKLTAIGAKLRPRIKVVTQAAQSPDLNICDLAFFRALGCVLRKRRRVASGASRSVLFDLDKLAADARAAFDDYSPETLEEMWAYKSIIM